MRKLLLFLVLILAGITNGQVLTTDPDGFKWQMFFDNGYVGAKDEKGKILIPSDYESVKSFGEDFLVKRGQFYGIYDRHGKCIIPARRYIQIKKVDGYKDSPYILTGYTTWAAVDKRGRILIPEDNYEFINIVKGSENDYYFTCCKNGFWGIFDLKGKMIIAPDKYSSIFRTGNKKDGYYYSFLMYGVGSGVCDSDGKELIRTKYQITQKVKDANGQYVYQIYHGNAYGKMDLNGHIISEPKTVKANVTNQPSVCKRADIKMKYNFICNENSVYGVADRTGNIVVPFKFDWIFQMENNFVVRKGRYMGAYDFQGNCIVPPTKYPVLAPSKEGGFTVKKDGLWTALDSSGKEILPMQFSAIDLCYNKNDSCLVARSTENNKLGLYRKSGKMLLPFKYDGIAVIFDPFVKDSVIYYLVTVNNRNGICNMSGEEIIAPNYTEITYRKNDKNGFFFVKNGTKEGVVDVSGRTIIPAEQFSAVSLNGGQLTASDGGHVCIFDLKGNLLSDNQPEVDRDNFIRLADAEFEKDHFKKAAEYYEHAIRIRASASLYFNKAVSLYNNNKYEQAISDFKKCLTMNPSQNLIDRSKYLIRKSREYQAEKVERRQRIASNILGLVFGAVNAYAQYKSQSSSRKNNYTATGLKRDTSLDYLLDPNYAIQQVKRENWNEYMSMTNGGTTMSYDEWYALKAQAWAESHNTDTSSSSTYGSSSSSRISPSTHVSDCRLCYGLGTCRTCEGKGYYYNSLDLSKTVTCPNCHNHDGLCTSCGGTGKKR